jgi:hypothetical protein
MAYEFERDEWRSAVAEMTALERVAACGHTGGRVRGVCLDCGHDAREEL